MFWLTHKILSTAVAALWVTTTTAAVDDGRRHRQGELLNMVRDGSGRVGATPSEDGGEGGRRTISTRMAISLDLWAKLGKTEK